jgi:uncharacterized protein (TIRG00374 family)
MAEMPGENLVINRPIQRSWQFWLGLAVSVVCLVLALREVNFGQVATVLARINGWWLGLAVLSVLATFLAKAIRWQMLFAASQKPALKPAFTTQAIGMLVNTFAPARLGDLARAYLMGEVENESKFYVLGTIAVEKMLDLGFLVLLVLWLFTRMVLPGWLADSLPGLLGGMIVVSMIMGLLVWQGDNLVDLLTRRLLGKDRANRFLSSKWVNWVAKKVHLGLRSLEVFRQPGKLFWVLVWSVVSWTLAVSTNSLVFLAFGLRLTQWASLFLCVVLQAGIAIPSSPGRIGVFHYLALITLIYLGVDKETALSTGVVLHLVVVGPVGLVGMLCLWLEKVTWNKLGEMIAQLNGMVKKAI